MRKKKERRRESRGEMERGLNEGGRGVCEGSGWGRQGLDSSTLALSF